MKKDDFIKELAKRVEGISQQKIEELLKENKKLILETLLKEGKYTLVGFGTFKIIERKARKGRNLKTGEIIDIPAKKTIKLIPSINIKPILNKK